MVSFNEKKLSTRFEYLTCTASKLTVSTGIGRTEMPAPRTSGMWNLVSAALTNSKSVSEFAAKVGALNFAPFLYTPPTLNRSLGAHLNPTAPLIADVGLASSPFAVMSLVACTELLEKSKVGVTRKVKAVSVSRCQRSVPPTEKLPILYAPERPYVCSRTSIELRNGRIVYCRHAKSSCACTLMLMQSCRDTG